MAGVVGATSGRLVTRWKRLCGCDAAGQATRDRRGARQRARPPSERSSAAAAHVHLPWQVPSNDENDQGRRLKKGCLALVDDVAATGDSLIHGATLMTSDAKLCALASLTTLDPTRIPARGAAAQRQTATPRYPYRAGRCTIRQPILRVTATRHWRGGSQAKPSAHTPALHRPE